MTVAVIGEAESFIREEVASGRFDSPQDVVREGLRLLHEREIVDRERREKLDRMIEDGLSQLERGEGIPGEQVFETLWEKSRKWREAR